MQEFIHVKGAREHNLKDIEVTLPRNKLVVLTGLSGSGKSSLAFDTIYAEGQRRYVESLSSYARQFLGQMEKPDVDYIGGLSPAISIDQKTTSRNPRSTVGTVTEIYDYLRLLWANIGTPHCPKCGKEIRQQTVDQILDQILALPEGSRIQLLAPVVRGKKGLHAKVLEDARKAGYVRVRVDGTIYDLSEDIPLEKTRKHTIEVVVDRVVVRPDARRRITDSVETASALSGGLVVVHVVGARADRSGTAGTGGQSDTVSGDGQSDITGTAGAGGQSDTVGGDGQSDITGTAGAAGGENDPGQTTDYELTFSQNYACEDCGISLEEFTPRMFSFNNPYGACPVCSGLGTQLRLSPERVLPNPELSLAQGAIHAYGWGNVEPGSIAHMYFTALGKRHGFTLDTPICEMSQQAVQELLYGTNGEKLEMAVNRLSNGTIRQAFEGILPNMERRYRETPSERARAEIEECMTETLCPACQGKRLRPEVLAVTVGGLNITDFCEKSIVQGMDFLQSLTLTDLQWQIGGLVLKEIKNRMGFLRSVGLEYLTLARASGTLSGGESQRIRLATQIGASLMGVLYVLDEPSIGLHQRDNDKLLATLKHLRDLGNTLLVVEHDEDTIRTADYVVDIGPGAGRDGGEVVYAGDVDGLLQAETSITGQYLSGRKAIPVPATRRPGNGHWLTVTGCAVNNLKHTDFSIPLGTFTCVTGVSGSGKSSFVNEILYKKLAAELNGAKTRAGAHTAFTGMEHLDKVVCIDQAPIGRTPRSNPATYTGVFGDIRELFAKTADAKARGYNASRFSFNVKGGRCEACTGDGLLKIEMHFLPDIYVPCDVCKGKRYNKETLEVRYKGKNIYEVLDMTVDEGCEFFANVPKIARRLATMKEVGLGYVKLGQSSTTLSGGEAQRIKLATELSRVQTGGTCYILDEPTTGLHVADVHRLVDVLHRLVELGNTAVVIEHNLDVIKTADYILDLGPEGGDRGGKLVVSGTPEQVAACPQSYTGQYLRPVLERSPHDAAYTASVSESQRG